MLPWKSKINILHLRSSGGFFGAEGVILNLTKKLNESGLNNLIVCLNNSKNPHVELLEEAKKIGLRTKSILCRGRLDLKAIFEIRHLLNQHKIDILHCHDYKANFFGFLASRFLNVKLVCTNHLWTKETFTLRIYEFLDAILINFFDKVIAVSEEVAKELQRICIHKKRLLTVYNGIDLTKYPLNSNGEKIRKEFHIPLTDKVVGSVGRLSTQKGFDYLLEAAKNVLGVVPDATFLVVGDGILKEHLEEKATNLGIKAKVIFTGKRDDMADIYNCMDIFVLPSVREGLPLVALEALAMRKPVIATNVGGTPSVIHLNRTGILLEPKNAQGLSGAIINLLYDRKKAHLFALNGRKFVEENFSAEAMAKAYRKVYEGLMQKKAVGR